MTAALIMYGQSPAENMVAAQDRVECAKAELKLAETELTAAFPPFREDARVQIKANDKSIADLRAGLVKPFRSKTNDADKQKIDDLESRNVALRDRLWVEQN